MCFAILKQPLKIISMFLYVLEGLGTLRNILWPSTIRVALFCRVNFGRSQMEIYYWLGQIQ